MELLQECPILPVSKLRPFLKCIDLHGFQREFQIWIVLPAVLNLLIPVRPVQMKLENTTKAQITSAILTQKGLINSIYQIVRKGR